MCTQKVSGKVMCDAMEEALINAGANFIFGTELMNVEYGEDDFVATFSDERIVEDGMLFLCLDNSPALKFYSKSGDRMHSRRFKEVHMELSTYY